ncbi:MAG: methionyl-tRNA formyltransferase [Pseudomonadota bacterium]
MTDSPRLVFAGTPEFAASSLAALLAAGYRPNLVLTQPDRPAGRGRALTPSPVKRLALDAGIEVYQPVSLRKPAPQERVAAASPDLLIVAAYGLILPQAVLDIPTVAPLNVHASLLPRWRGAAPIQHAILAGDTQTGIALMRMEAGLDTGPVYATAAIDIGVDETAGELHDRLAQLGGELLVAKLPAIIDGALEAEKQPDTGACYAPKVEKADARIDWHASAATIARQVRAYDPWPVAHTSIEGSLLRIFGATAANEVSEAPAGVIVRVDDAGIAVATGAGTLIVTAVQLAGKRRIPATDFANQRTLRGIRLGEAD